MAFQSPKDSTSTTEAAEDSGFKLYSDRERAMRETDTVAETFIMYFQGSLRGLSVGAPVDLRGINIGEVKRLSVEYDRVAGELRFPVEVDIFPQRIRARERTPHAKNSDFSDMGGHTMIDSMVAHGMRAELKDGNLLTGQKYVAVDVVKGAAHARRWPGMPIRRSSPPPRAASTRSPTRSGASPRSSTRCPSIRSPAI